MCRFHLVRGKESQADLYERVKKCAVLPQSAQSTPEFSAFSSPRSQRLTVSSQALMRSGKLTGQSCKTTLRREALTFRPPLYSMNPNFLNLFMKKFTRERVVPTISASIS